MYRPTSSFLCVHNAGRSQMAAALARKFGGDRVVVLTGGSDPADQVNPVAVEALQEIGIELEGVTPMHWDRPMLERSDVIVTMGCGESCPVLPGKRYVDWSLEDPSGLELQGVRRVRDQLASLVENLIAEVI